MKHLFIIVLVACLSAVALAQDQIVSPMFQPADCPTTVTLTAEDAALSYDLHSMYAMQVAQGSLEAGESVSLHVPESGDWFILIIQYQGDYTMTLTCQEAEADTPEPTLSPDDPRIQALIESAREVWRTFTER